MKPYHRVAVGYAVFGIFWIVLSDLLAGTLADNIAGLTHLQTLKGGLFVVLSSLWVLVITRRAFTRHARTEAEKHAVFNKTVEGSYHILLNYLNQMQIVTMEAEQCENFDSEVLRMAAEAAGEAERELKKLGAIQTVTAEHIDAVIYDKIRNPGNRRG